MRKFSLWSGIISSIICAITAIIYYSLVFSNVIEIHKISYLFLIAFLGTSWVPYLLELIFKWQINKYAIISYIVFLFLSTIMGSLWGMYGIFEHYDTIIHALSGVIIALIAYSLFENSKSSKSVSMGWMFVVIFSITMACGGLWEIWEFVTDLLMDGNSQRFMGFSGQAALMDTMIDIICDFSGGILGSIVAVILYKRKVKN